MNKVCYIYRLCPTDFGPAEHVSAIMKYCDINLSIGHNPFNSKKNHIQIPLGNSWSKNLYFQIQSCIHLLIHRNQFDIVLHRLSIGDFIIGMFCRILQKDYVLEINGDLDQDLIDRNKSYFIKKFQSLLLLINFSLATGIYLVHSNLMSVINRYLTTKSLLNQKIVVVENGFEPVEFTSNDKFLFKDKSKIIIGYLGSLSPREGVDEFISLIQKYNTSLFGLIVGGTTSEFLKLLSEKQLSCTSIKHFENCNRKVALKILSISHYFVFLRRPKNSILSGSSSQGAPLKLLDYMFLQRPIIFSRLPSNEFFVSNNIGIYVEEFEHILKNESPSTLHDFSYNNQFSKNYYLNSTWSSRLTILKDYFNSFN